MKKLGFILAIVVFALSSAFAEISDDLAACFRTGNAKEFSKFFDGTIDLDIPGNEGTYSKAQAEQILKDFFSKSHVKGYTPGHQGESKEGARFLMGTLNTIGGAYRTYIHVRKVGDVYTIKELRIENN